MNWLDDNSRPGFFKDYHKTVRGSVSQEQLKAFGDSKTDEERVRFLFALPATHDISVKAFYRGKSESEALNLKEAGNKAFVHKNNLEALKLYSQAVIKAPVPSEENADPKKMTLYSICLANRSAALFHLKEYYYCIKDIEEALDHHYPKDLKYKLFKRKGRLLVSFKRHEDALDSFKQALKWLDWAKMEREKRIDQQTEIQKWIRLFQGAKVLKNAPWEDVELFPKVPELLPSPNSKFPSLSQKIKVEYTEMRGRYAVASTDILPGDYVCTEKPYASVLSYEEYGTHCQKCFVLTKAAIPCKKCAGVLFCSSECREASYFHKIECSIMDLLVGSGMSINCFLALRMVTQTPLSDLMNIRDSLTDENLSEILEKEEPYNPLDFKRVYNLVRHPERRSAEDFFHRSLMAVFLVKALKKTRYFNEYAASPTENVNDAEVFVGGLLLRFLQIVQFNAHEVSEFVLAAPRTLENSTNASIGAAIYPSLALFNHSCQSALVRYFSGNQVITKAVRPLSKGEVVPENYGPAFTTKAKAERRSELSDRYWFDCNCQPCEENWPTYKEMDNSVFKFKCQKCRAPIPVNVNTPTPFFTCSQCNDQTNILSALKNLQNTEQTFKAATKEMMDFNLEKAETLLIENLNQLNNSLYPPYKDYHLTQEALMRCCLCFGNRKVKIPTHSKNLENGKK